MKTVFVTSNIEYCEKYYDENGNKVRIAQNFGNRNNILTNLKKHIKRYENLLIVASDENDFEATDMYARPLIESFNLTLPFKNYNILDGRTEKNAKEMIDAADLIYLMGGHVPTQNKFFKNINLRELLKNYNNVIVGVSAGSMNSADIVYCPPELEGEGKDKNFKRYLKGLGLTKINILPHYYSIIEVELDGLPEMEYCYKDSYIRPILVLPDGSYFIEKNEKVEIFGESFLLKNGELTKLSNENERLADFLFE